MKRYFTIKGKIDSKFINNSEIENLSMQLKLELDSSTVIQQDIFKDEKITDILLVLNLRGELPNYPL